MQGARRRARVVKSDICEKQQCVKTANFARLSSDRIVASTYCADLTVRYEKAGETFQRNAKSFGAALVAENGFFGVMHQCLKERCSEKTTSPALLIDHTRQTDTPPLIK